MKMVVVGGNSRDIGKTSVVTGLIRALPQYDWTAVKLTLYANEEAPAIVGESACLPKHLPFAITEETDRNGSTDTSRFLLAGARRALWVRAWRPHLEGAVPALQQAIAGDDFVILESNSILRFHQPSVYLMVLDPSCDDFKESAAEFLCRADAFLALEPDLARAAWHGVFGGLLGEKPVFRLSRDFALTPDIREFVQDRLLAWTRHPA